MCKIRVIFQERLKIEVKLLLGTNICRVDWHNNGDPMSLSDIEWPFHASLFVLLTVRTEQAVSPLS